MYLLLAIMSKIRFFFFWGLGVGVLFLKSLLESSFLRKSRTKTLKYLLSIPKGLEILVRLYVCINYSQIPTQTLTYHLQSKTKEKLSAIAMADGSLSTSRLLRQYEDRPFIVFSGFNWFKPPLVTDNGVIC